MRGWSGCRRCNGTGSWLQGENLHESEGWVPCYDEPPEGEKIYELSMFIENQARTIVDLKTTLEQIAKIDYSYTASRLARTALEKMEGKTVVSDD